MLPDNQEIVILCPKCEWRPDGEPHWRCNCGCSWNTFETKGVCPICSEKFETTSCPGCRTSNLHSDWYTTESELLSRGATDNNELRIKKKKIEERLIGSGIRNLRISHLPYLDQLNYSVHSTTDTGARMIILYAMAFLSQNLDDRSAVAGWLKEQSLWSQVSGTEKQFLQDDTPDEEQLIDLSWNIEGALTLAWCMNLITDLPKLDGTKGDGQYDSNNSVEQFQNSVPALGESLAEFMAALEFRSVDEIHTEYLFNELVTTYFRDLMFNGKEDATKICRAASYERHKVLSWLTTRYMDESDITGELWDEVDTST